MDPTSQSTSNFELPSPVPRGETPAAAPEQAPMQESAPAPHASAPAPVAPPITPVDPSQFATSSAAHPMPTQPIVTPAVADDLDLIEKEWVEKAKSIVTATRSDPHAQNKQMNHFKADYMKKRYNKDIKLPESS